MRSPLVSLFKSYWDNRFSRNRKHRFVLCGSISSFMVKKVIRSEALYGRISTEINLQPLTLAESFEFFAAQRPVEEVLEIAMCLGCIPQYLKELNPGLSLMQNLNEHAFSKTGYFFGEYQRIFISHFGKNPVYENILRQLSARPRTADLLASSCRMRTGGRFTELLADLELAGFIERYSPIDKGPRSRQVRFRILDEYLHFYYRFIDKARQEIMTGRFEPAQIVLGRDWRQWQGYAFERLCRRHSGEIADALRFSGIRYKAGSWFEPPTSDFKGVQIDLLFERADRMITVCEAKCSDRIQAGQLVEDFESKCRVLRRRFPRHGLQKVLISGRRLAIPDKVRKFFDAILFAPEIFFRTPPPKTA